MDDPHGDAGAMTFTASHDGACDDVQLLRRIGRGDEDAMAAFYREHGRVVLAQVLLVTGERVLAEEILQDTMLAVWRGAGSFRGESSARSWVIAIARRQTRDRLRGRRLRVVDDAFLADQPGRAAVQRGDATGLRPCQGDGIGREGRWFHRRDVRRNPGSGDHLRRHARHSAPRQPGPAARRRTHLRPWARRTARDAVGKSGGSGLAAPARDAHRGARTHRTARGRLPARRDRRGARLRRLIRHTPMMAGTAAHAVPAHACHAERRWARST